MNKYLIGFVILLVLLLGFTCRSNRSLRSTINRQVANISAINDTIKQYQLEDGRQVAEIQSLKSTAKELKLLNNGLFNEKKNLEKQLRIQASQIQQLQMQANIVTKYDTIHVLQEFIDSITSRITLEAEEIDSVVTTKVVAEFDLAIDSNSFAIGNKHIQTNLDVHGLKLSIVTGYRRKGIFRRNEEFISAVTTNDERFTISSIESWVDSDYKKSSFILIRPALFGGVIYDPFNNQFGGGVGLGIAIVRGK